jgi:hypothetical protein
MPSNEQTIYPQGLDTFTEVQDVDTPDNLVQASLINKAQNALSAIQAHTVYTAKGLDLHSPILAALFQTQKFTSNTSKHRFNFRFDIEPAVADGLFSGAPFHRDVAVIPSMIGYRVQNGNRIYYRTDAVVAMPAENSRSCVINCIRYDNPWSKGDVIECSLLLVKTGLAALT